MARQLKYAVGLLHEGETHWFTPEDTVPAWAVKLINPERFEDSTESDGDAEPAQPEPPAVPPRSGKGSGLAQWAKYADAHDVEIADDASRDDIIAALDAAGIPTGADAEPDPAADAAGS